MFQHILQKNRRELKKKRIETNCTKNILKARGISYGFCGHGCVF